MTRTRVRLGLLAAALLVAGVIGGPTLWRWIRILNHARVAAAREPAALATWRQAFSDPDVLEARYLHASDNPAATRLIVLAKPLGIELEGTSPDSADVRAIAEYVTHAARISPSGDVDAPPAIVRAYLDRHRSDIEAIVDWLAGGPAAPIWKCSVSAPVPLLSTSANLFALGTLNNVLAADALVDVREGRTANADRTMQAAWQLVRSSRDHPLIVEQLISISQAVDDDRVIRRIAGERDGWRARLGEYDDVAGLERSVQMEAVRRIRVNAGGSFVQRGFLADYLDETRTDLERMRTLALVDDSPGAPLDEQAIAPGTAVAAGLARTRRAGLCAELDVELTDRVFDARQAKAEGGRWPSRMSDLASTVVPDARWVYAAHGNDAISISLSRSVPSCPGPMTFDTRR